jgi:carbamoyltransferase
MTIQVLGISAFYHDSAATLLSGGKIVAAAQEERFSRVKGDPRFPIHAVEYCMKEGMIRPQDLDHIVFYDDPRLKFTRLLETYIAFSPKGVDSFVEAMSAWVPKKLFMKKLISENLNKLWEIDRGDIPQISFCRHHLSHAASAFFPSPFEEAAVLCLDGVGEWTTSSVWRGEGNNLKFEWEMTFPHSLGLLYSAFTSYTGFRVNFGEYKMMGLAPYGEPKYVPLILERLMDLKEDGTFRLNMNYFDFATGFSMTSPRFHDLFGGPPRKPESPITQKEMDIARSIQDVTEEIILRLATTIRDELGKEYLCIAGGVGLNAVANGRIIREGIFRDVWIQPAAGDAGGSLGAAQALLYCHLHHPRSAPGGKDGMQGGFLGPSYSDEEIRKYLDDHRILYQHLDDSDLFARVSRMLAEGRVVGWFQGRMEFGPRALGARSILGDPRNPKMQHIMNLKIKFRESFRPFAPSVLDPRVSDYFELDRPSPYMLVVANIRKELRNEPSEREAGLFGIEKLNVARSSIPAVTHVDYSARIQTVHPDANPRFYQLIRFFEELTGCGVVINTSFNVRGEPIVCSPNDAYRCFMRTGMDYLVLEHCMLDKEDQGEYTEDEDWRKKYELD